MDANLANATLTLTLTTLDGREHIGTIAAVFENSVKVKFTAEDKAHQAPGRGVADGFRSLVRVGDQWYVFTAFQRWAPYNRTRPWLGFSDYEGNDWVPVTLSGPIPEVAEPAWDIRPDTSVTPLGL
jgi:hypothetical protein